MADLVIQTSFSSGELAPSLAARVDLSKYKAGAARMRNFFVDYRSGASTMMGTRFVSQVLVSSKAVRLIPFQYSIQDTFALEFGDQYIRFVSNGGMVLETAQAISAASNTNPANITVPSHTWLNGDWIFISGVVGMTQLNGRFYSITVAGSTVTLYDVNGDPIDATAYGTYMSGGTAARVYTLASPYLAADLAELKFTQSASVLTITHPNYAPRNLTQVSAANWTLTLIVFGTTVTAPAAPTITASAVGAANYAYVVTAIDSAGQESIASTPGSILNAVNISTTAGTITITWVAVPGAISYNIYKAEFSVGSPVPAGSAYGFIEQATGVEAKDSNIVPDFTQTPPLAQNPFLSNNPIAVTYFQQRQCYFSSTNFPMTFWMSQPGNFNNFNKSDPIQDSDAITGTLVSDQVNQIQSAKAMPGGLVVLTAKGAWQISGGGGVGANSPVTPATLVATPQAYNGASGLPPIVSNFDMLYVQAKGSIVRDLSYNIYANIYTGQDISVLSNHLFENKKLVEWSFAEEPHKLIFAIRDDGVLLTLTFVKEQEIFGWARHDTKGLYKSVASISETSHINSNVLVDAVYVVVKRLVQGRWVQYIERFAERSFPYGVEDCWAVHSGVQSTLTRPVAGLTASAATGTVTFTSTTPVFSAGDVGAVLRMGGGIATITTFVSGSQLIGTLTQDITDVLANDDDNTPVPALSGNWSIAQPSTTFSGLDHLEGQLVSILADGGVVARQRVVGGNITLPKAASKVTAGLGYTAQLQTMQLDVGDPTIQTKRKKINALTIRGMECRGLHAGRTFETLVPLKDLFSSTTLDEPSPLITDDQRVVMDPLWDDTGQVCIQVSDPVPATILGVIPDITVGDGK